MSDSYSFGDNKEDIGPYTPLKNFRKQYYQELRQKPQVYRKLLALTKAEVGNQGEEAQQAFIETVMNRAASRRQSLDATMQSDYYPGLGNIDKVSPKERANYTDLIDQTFSGSNVGNYATGNASGTVGFNKGPQVAEYGGERYGIEGPDVRTMRGIAGGEINPSEAAAFTPTGRTRMAEDNGVIGALGGLFGQQQGGGGGLLGMLNDPQKMAYLAMIAKGLSPYSDINPGNMLEQAQKLQLRKQELARQDAIRQMDQKREDAYRNRNFDYKDRDDLRLDADARLRRDEIQRKRELSEEQRKADAGARSILGGGGTATADTTVPDAGTIGAIDKVLPPDVAPTDDGSPGATGQTGKTSEPSRDDVLRAQNKKIREYMDNDKITKEMHNGLQKRLEQNEAMIGTPAWVTTPEMAKKYNEAIVGEKVTTERSKPAREQVYRGTINAADEALKMMDEETGPISSLMKGMGVSRLTGAPAWLAKKYPGASPAAEFGEKLETIKAGTQIETMIALKQASSTGSTGLGALTEKEGEILQRIQGSLNQERQSPESLRRNITRARNFAQAMKDGITLTEENEDAILNRGLTGQTSAPKKMESGTDLGGGFVLKGVR